MMLRGLGHVHAHVHVAVAVACSSNVHCVRFGVAPVSSAGTSVLRLLDDKERQSHTPAVEQALRQARESRRRT